MRFSSSTECLWGDTPTGTVCRMHLFPLPERRSPSLPVSWQLKSGEWDIPSPPSFPDLLSILTTSEASFLSEDPTSIPSKEVPCPDPRGLPRVQLSSGLSGPVDIGSMRTKKAMVTRHSEPSWRVWEAGE